MRIDRLNQAGHHRIGIREAGLNSRCHHHLDNNCLHRNLLQKDIHHLRRYISNVPHHNYNHNHNSNQWLIRILSKWTIAIWTILLPEFVHQRPSSLTLLRLLNLTISKREENRPHSSQARICSDKFESYDFLRGTGWTLEERSSSLSCD